MTGQFPRRLSAAMKNQNISYRKLEFLTGIDAASLSRYSSGAIVPNSSQITIIAEALNVNSSWLLGETSFSPPIPEHISGPFLQAYASLPPKQREESERYVLSLQPEKRPNPAFDIFLNSSIPIYGRRLGKLLLKEGLSRAGKERKARDVSFHISLKEYFEGEISGTEKKVKRVMGLSIESLLKLELPPALYCEDEKPGSLFKNISIDYEDSLCFCKMDRTALKWVKHLLEGGQQAWKN